MKKKDAEILIAIGSNIHQEENVAKAKELLVEHFPDVDFSRELWTEPIGLESDKFLNLLALAHTDTTADDVQDILKEVEERCGACKTDKHQGRVVIDLDLLSYNDTRYHSQDWQRNYIQQLLKDFPRAF